MPQQNSRILLSTAYFPPIQYFTLFVGGRKVIIEGHENYTKQTYRNRCKIYSPNGIQVLSVPVERGSFHKVNISDLRIDYSRSWQKDHLRALKTAYNSSAFYEFYIDEVSAIILKGYKYLLEMNMEALKIIMSVLELENHVSKSDKFEETMADVNDFRSTIHPKKEDVEFNAGLPEYFQVFAPETGFNPNLSILDLIFNMGPESYSYLMSYQKK